MMRIFLIFAGIMGLSVLPVSIPAQMVPAGEVQVTSPDLTTGINDATAELAAGAREVQVRIPSLTAVEVNAAFLCTDCTTNVLPQLRDQVGPGQKVEFRVGDQRFRVQNEAGQLRVRVRDVALTEVQAQDLAKALAGADFGRVEIRARDAAGDRIRIELRDGVVKKDEVKPDHSGRGRGREGTSSSINNERGADRGRDRDHSIRGRDRAELEKERTNRHDGRRERVERREKAERLERAERPEKAERHERGGRIERADRSGRH